MNVAGNWQKRVYRRRIKDFKTKDEWHKLRIACLERDHYTCQRCEMRNKQGRGLSAHHMMPRSEEGADDIENLITLCHPCHDYVEILGLKTKTDIIGSYESAPVEMPKVKKDMKHKESFERPDWHRYVYGGARQSDRR